MTLLLLPEEIRRLRRVRRDAQEDERTGGLGEVMATARTVEARSFGGARDPGPYRRTRGSDRSDPVLVRIAWPVYEEASATPAPPTVRVDGRRVRAEPVARADLSQAVREAHRDRRTEVLAKSLLRAVVKLSAAEALEEAISEEDETLGEAVGWSARIAGALLERADTRSWHSLPARLELYRLRLPAGTHRVEAVVPGAAKPELDLGTVKVAPGTIRIVAGRAWR